VTSDGVGVAPRGRRSRAGGQALFSEELEAYESLREQQPFGMVQEFTMGDGDSYAEQYPRTCSLVLVRGLCGRYGDLFIQSVSSTSQEHFWYRPPPAQQLSFHFVADTEKNLPQGPTPQGLVFDEGRACRKSK
jgi:hypothetical protein